MEYITESYDHNYHIDMSILTGRSVDNADALGRRYLVVFVTKGSGIARFDRKSVPFIAPCVFCVNEREHFVIPESDRIEILTIYFSPSTINSLLNFSNVRKLPKDMPETAAQDVELIKSFLDRNEGYCGKYSIGSVSEKRMLNLFGRMDKVLKEQASNWPCRSRSFLFEILFLLDNLYEAGCVDGDVSLDEADEEINPILIYLYENYDQKIAIQDLTDRFHLSKSTLSKLFKDSLDESFLTYLNRLRISIAGTMLRDTLLPVSEIMVRVGFNDNVHFLRTFKKYCGVSPSEYREKYNWM